MQDVPRSNAGKAGPRGGYTIRAVRESVSLFKYLSPIECRVIYTLTDRRTFDEDDVIIREGEPGKGLHIVERGEVAVLKRDPRGMDRPVAMIGPSGHFGEMSILNDQPTICTVTALGPVEVLIMSKAEFTNLMHRSESLGIGILRALSEELSNRLRELWEDRLLP